eukprot:8527094-Prorocentrum_lima.AAC.1
MTSSLVGSEMCIRDRYTVRGCGVTNATMGNELLSGIQHVASISEELKNFCLLYTSDAADDM